MSYEQWFGTWESTYNYKPHICEFSAGFLFLWNVTFIHWTIFSFFFHVYKIKFRQPYNLKVSWIIIISNLDYLASYYFWIGIYPPHCIYLSKRQCDSVSYLKKKNSFHNFHVLHHLQGKIQAILQWHSLPFPIWGMSIPFYFFYQVRSCGKIVWFP